MQKSCIVVPCYNEAKRLDVHTFERFVNATVNVDFLFVNDGSTDSTLSILLEARKNEGNDRFDVLDLGSNRGKAEAVRQGFLKAVTDPTYQFIGYWDADLATPLEEVTHLVTQLDSMGKKAAFGSRVKRMGATIERKSSRHFFGRVFSTFGSMILRLPVYDSQCGAKIFSRDLVFLFDTPFITSWIFDVELLARYRNAFGRKIVLQYLIEVPLGEWIEKGGSKLKLRHLLKVPFELFLIHWTYNRNNAGKKK